MTRNTEIRPTPRITYDEPLTFEDVSQFWQHYDEPLTSEERLRLQHRRTPRVVVIGWCVYGVFCGSILATLPTLLRAVGGS